MTPIPSRLSLRIIHSISPSLIPDSDRPLRCAPYVPPSTRFLHVGELPSSSSRGVPLSPLRLSTPTHFPPSPTCPTMATGKTRREEGRRERERWNIIAAITLGESISEKGMEEAKLGESRARLSERAHCVAKQKQSNSSKFPLYP